MARAQDGAAQPALVGGAEQELFDGGLLRPVVAERLAGLVLGDGHLHRTAVHPDGPAVQEVGAQRDQGFEQLAGRGHAEAHEVDHRVRTQRRHPGAEGGGPVLGFPVDLHPLDLVPGRVLQVRAPLAPAHGDDLVTGHDQPGDQVSTYVARGPHYQHLHELTLRSWTWTGTVARSPGR